jgi:hypothetical protein
MSLTQSELADLAGLNAGRNPQWTALALAPKDPPTISTTGIAVADTTITAVAVQLRRDPRRPGIVIEVPGSIPLVNTTYAFTLDGEAYSVTITGGSVSTLLAVATAVANEVLAGTLHQAVVETSQATNRRIVVWRVNSAMPGAVSATTNITEVQREEETSAEVTIWGKSAGLDGWYQVGQTDTLAITANWTDIIRSSPLSHIYVQAVTDDTSAAARYSLGPCAVQASGA